MNDEQIDSVLSHAPAMPPATAEKIRSEIFRDTQPVKPMMSSSTYSLLFLALFVVVSEAYATVLKMNGLRVLPVEAAVALLLLFALIAALGSNAIARSMRPASGRLNSWLLSLIAVLGYEGLVFYFFRGMSTEGFIHNGLNCLGLGLLGGLLLASPLWLFMRRGIIVEPIKAGAAFGLVAGLSGLAALTLYCPLLTRPHMGIWHAAVVGICIGLGSFVGSLAGMKTRQ